ncbi:probable Splicing factor 3b, subunit 2 [Ustilago trichophora]|uniref:Probable Splicing factor 3b, subunit 2 n=1 Tax=Ustilago trichophora TaxID=86804 RepID=A0A5C3EHW8_9BASI|nr:probable Splicing factor 3b, subunit 2 [Ustilago trichophora]
METNAVAGPSNGNASIPLTKNAKRRLKKKQQQQQQQPQPSQPSASNLTSNHSITQESLDNDKDDEAVPSSASTIIDQAAAIHIDPDSEAFKVFSNVLSRYQPSALSLQQQPSKGEVIYSDEEVASEHDSSNEQDQVSAAAAARLLSKRKQKKLQRLSVAELKQLVRKPEVVEWTDVTSNDPRLLVHLKCTRNSVPIPPHWAHKRDYLQNKRGIEKAPYQLPPYIADTGIATMKDALKQKEAEESLKQKTRQRVQPKMGKMDIDYQKLYDAFFKFQTKPPLSAYGDTYYEGKEFETKFKDKRPGGQLSKELVEALSIPPLAPPPWLISMQRYGPPPSYPHLAIPGLNAPIPEGAQWGFHPGGWGRPPVDEWGNPLYGNVLGNVGDAGVDGDLVDKVDKEHWGMLEPEESDVEEESEAEQEQETEDEQQQQQQQQQDTIDTSGLESVSTNVGSGLSTPSFTQLRKDARLSPPSQSRQPTLYQVLPERAVTSSSSSQGQFMSSERVYDLSSTYSSTNASALGTGPVLGSEANTSSRGTKRTASDAVQVSINPDHLESQVEDKIGLAERYDHERRVKAQSRFTHNDDQQGVAQVRQELERERRKVKEKERRVVGSSRR